ncbi:diguanylate cyclase [Photobacterium angustum]|uniref:GGDEF domain-containing protein n=1 Tax=Photobacterium angustum TaxID=661 RepID=UPI0005E8C06B|nr:GGDEF domain-containing protein [Photobacterium angustum]KJG06085.1 diguanylate cyclase [Photobacterium angustum]PSV88538.1 GGDEF domain-containing protein [Photobacterium angustum]
MFDKITHKNKTLIPFIKPFVLFFTIISSGYFAYNAYHLEKFYKQYFKTINSVYSVSRRFSSFYNNTDIRLISKGQQYFNGVSVVINHTSEVKNLSKGINLLRDQLDQLTDNNIWTIAVFDNPATHAYFDPARTQYLESYKNYEKNSVIKRIIDKEGLGETYSYFYGCNMKMTEKYVEDGSNQAIRTLYYPIYNNRKLDALLAIDIKNNILNDALKIYNNKYKTVLYSNPSKYDFSIKKLLPCSSQDPFYVGVNLFHILKYSLIPALSLTFFIYWLTAKIKTRRFSLQRDLMTNFYRRDYYEKKLHAQKGFCLLIIDIDHFKSINDTYGHEVGDEVIRKLAERLGRCIRQSDIAIRWGGEEFILSFTSMTKEQLKLKAEKIRHVVQVSPIHNIAVTISIGGTVSDTLSFNEAYKVSDDALYQSKHNGRNQSTIV